MNIGGFVKNSFVDYPQKIACVIFTTGCNMDCWYCHNKHLLNNDFSKVSNEEIFTFLETHKPFLDAVVISGGEPTIQNDLLDYIKRIKNMDYLVKLDTNGTNYNILKSLVENRLVDYVAMDIKAPLDKYELVTSKSDVEEIKKSIELLKLGKIDYEFRTTLSPNLTMSDIKKIAKTLQGADKYSLQKLRYDNLKSSFNFYEKDLINYIKSYKKKTLYKCIKTKVRLIIPTQETLINVIKYNSKNSVKDNKSFIKLISKCKAEHRLLMAKEIASKYIKNVTIKGL